MIGCILTGHGSFAPGLSGALEMIAGPQTNFEVVPFKEEDNLEQFQAKMLGAIEKLQQENSELVIFCDLMGGTPFNVAMMASQNMKEVEVIAGVNLPLLIETMGMRLAEIPLTELVTHIIEVGKGGLARVEIASKSEEDNEEEEGI